MQKKFTARRSPLARAVIGLGLALETASENEQTRSAGKLA